MIRIRLRLYKKTFVLYYIQLFGNCEKLRTFLVFSVECDNYAAEYVGMVF